MQTKLDYKRDFLCVLLEFEVPDGKHSRTLVKEWYPVHSAEEAEARALVGRPVTATNPDEAIYVDEEGNVFQLLDKGETKPIEVEHLPGREKTELEVLLEASLKGRKTDKQKDGMDPAPFSKTASRWARMVISTIRNRITGRVQDEG